jgi:plasmid replication initiation protein
MTFTLSIEETNGESRQHGFHLGTIERIAREIVEDKMRVCRENDWPAVTMALVQDGKIFDVLYRDGKWHSRLI